MCVCSVLHKIVAHEYSVYFSKRATICRQTRRLSNYLFVLPFNVSEFWVLGFYLSEEAPSLCWNLHYYEIVWCYSFASVFLQSTVVVTVWSTACYVTLHVCVCESEGGRERQRDRKYLYGERKKYFIQDGVQHAGNKNTPSTTSVHIAHHSHVYSTTHTNTHTCPDTHTLLRQYANHYSRHIFISLCTHTTLLFYFSLILL